MANKAKNNRVEKPSAWVVSSDKGRKSIKNGKVYLKDKEEFQIELFNPLSDCVLADIKLNGNAISESGLVLRPGERFYLDCFIDDKKKFVFSTYEVEESNEAKLAISKNGMLEVFFYKESVVGIRDWRRRFDRVIVEKYYPVYYPHYQPYWYATPNVYCGTTITTGGFNQNNGTFTTTNSLTNIGTTNTAYLSDTINASYTSGISISDLGITNTSVGYSANSIETGRVEKGSASSQKFDEIDMDFDKFHISSTVLQLLPESVKPAETKELNREKAAETASGDDVIALIKKLADLKSAGILTEEEFSEKKAELLSRI